jgi:hypothetical protein
MLDVAIGMSLVVALFAGLVGGANEILARIFGRRGWMPYDGIATLSASAPTRRRSSSARRPYELAICTSPGVSDVPSPRSRPHRMARAAHGGRRNDAQLASAGSQLGLAAPARARPLQRQHRGHRGGFRVPLWPLW